MELVELCVEFNELLLQLATNEFVKFGLQSHCYKFLRNVSTYFFLVCNDTGMGAMAGVDNIIQSIREMVKI